jgi:hypothetical protein
MGLAREIEIIDRRGGRKRALFQFLLPPSEVFDDSRDIVIAQLASRDRRHLAKPVPHNG